jgi:HAE1 family hydrophobic/amphiphilic exporter-1
MHPRFGPLAAASFLAIVLAASGAAALLAPAAAVPEESAFLAVAPASPAAAPASPAAAPASPAAAPTPGVPAAAVLPPVPSVEPSFRPESSTWPAGDLVGVTQEPFVGLSLQDALAMALAKNTDLAVAASSRKIAGFQIVAAQGAYDLRFQIAPSYTYAKSAPQNAFAAGPGGGPITQSTFGASAALSGQTSGGTRYSFGTSATRTNNDLTANSFDPFYTTSLSLNLTQPLLRGAKIDDSRRALALAKIGADASSDALLLASSSTIASVQNAYYDLIAAWRNLAIQEDALRQARAQSESNARLVKAGQLASVDVVESDNQVNIFQDNVFSAVQNVERLQNALKTQLLGDPADPIWTANLVPTSTLGDLLPDPNVTDVVVAALRNRPEIAQLRDQRRGAAVNLAYAKDQTKPQVDLQLGYTANGFAGTPASATANPLASAFGPQVTAINQLIAIANASLPVAQQLQPVSLQFASVPGYTNGKLGQAYTNMFDNRFPQVSLQAVIALPLRNRTADANAAAAAESVRSVETQQVALIQRLQVESRNAVQGYRSARSRLTAATAGRQAAESVLASEQRKFTAGQSTTYLVLQREVNLANSRGRELQAQTDLFKAVVELDRVGGTILSHNGIDATSLSR